MSECPTARIKELEALLLGAHEQLTKALARISELERRLGLTSETSSKPPSSDGLKRANRTKSLRKKGLRKKGGQKGHKGTTLKASANPEHTVIHPVTECDGCKSCLKDVVSNDPIIRQVFDLPKINLEVTEHQAERKSCPHCQKTVQAKFPADVKAPVQYGAGVKSLVAYLRYQHFIPEVRLKSICADIFGFSIATASIAKFGEELSEKLTGFIAAVKDYLLKAPVKHADETGYRVIGVTGWLHSLSNGCATWYETTVKRKRLLTELSGVLVHDGFKAYSKQLGILSALCNQHHLRELQALIIIEKEPWARSMRRFLLTANKIKKAYNEIPILIQQNCTAIFLRIVGHGIKYHESLPPLPKPKRGRIPLRIGHNLLLRFKNQTDATLRFITNHLVPFTNNQAEQDIRMAKLVQKISGGFRSTYGADIFCNIRSFLSTARKHAWDIFQSIANIFQNTATVWSFS